MPQTWLHLPAGPERSELGWSHSIPNTHPCPEDAGTTRSGEDSDTANCWWTGRVPKDSSSLTLPGHPSSLGPMAGTRVATRAQLESLLPASREADVLHAVTHFSLATALSRR